MDKPVAVLRNPVASSAVDDQEALLLAAIEQSDQYLNYENSVFLAKRLLAISGSENNARRLATQLIKLRKYRRAVHVLRDCSSLETLYLRAKCHYHLEEYQQAEICLRGDDLSSWPPRFGQQRNDSMPSHDATPSRLSEIPGRADGYYLLGLIYQIQNRKAEARFCFEAALQKNPLIWVAFESLARMGDDILATQGLARNLESDSTTLKRYFPEWLEGAREERPLTSDLREVLETVVPSVMQTEPKPSIDEYSLSHFKTPQEKMVRLRQDPAFGFEDLASMERGNNADIPVNDAKTGKVLNFTPTPGAVQHPTPMLVTVDPAPDLGASPRAADSFSTPAAVHATPCSGIPVVRSSMDEVLLNTNQSSLDGSRDVQARSMRESFDEGNSTLRAPANNNIFRPPNPPRKTMRVSQTIRKHENQAAHRMLFPSDISPKEEGRRSWQQEDLFEMVPLTVPVSTESGMSNDTSSAMNIMMTLANAVSALYAYKCQDALSLFACLPKSQYETPFVYSCVGRCYLELNMFSRAELAFEHALELDPCYLQNVAELYSTVLWHMKKEIALTELAHHCVSVDDSCASTWCVVGNCMSLHRETDSALMFFKRAYERDAFCAYAHTLAGHEYIMKEDFDMALHEYHQALSIDTRHYNALYGIGHVHLRKEQFVESQRYLKRALEINPRSATLHYHLGNAYAMSMNLDDALQELDIATLLDPRNPIAQFEKSRILLLLNRPNEALKHFERLCQLFPKEASVYFEMGKVQKSLGNLRAALSLFSIALDLDPKERMYRRAIDVLETEIGNNSNPNQHPHDTQLAQ